MYQWVYHAHCLKRTIGGKQIYAIYIGSLLALRGSMGVTKVQSFKHHSVLANIKCHQATIEY